MKWQIGLTLLLLLCLGCASKTVDTDIQMSSVPALGNVTEGEVFYQGKQITKEIHWYFGDEAMFTEPVVLKDNSAAQDVSYAELMAFLEETRPKRAAINGFDSLGFPIGEFKTCGYYIEDLHDRAEMQGIRAGMVLLLSDESHGINVFNTTDKGLVYVDPSYYEDKVFLTLTAGEEYEVYGRNIIIEDIAIIWEGEG